MPAELMGLQVTLVNLAKEARSPQQLLELARAANPSIAGSQLGRLLKLTAGLPGVRDGSLAKLLRDAAMLAEADDRGV